MPTDDAISAPIAAPSIKSPPPVPKSYNSAIIRTNPAAMDWVVPLISGAVLAGFFSMLALLLISNSISALGDVKDVLFVLLGVLGAAFIQVVNYWLGSSKGSSDQTNVLLQR